MASTTTGRTAKPEAGASGAKAPKTRSPAKEKAKVEKNQDSLGLFYTAKLDTKKRITIRGAKYQYYAVIPQSDDTFLLKPQVLLDLEDIPKETLRMMDAPCFDRAGQHDAERYPASMGSTGRSTTSGCPV